MAQTGLAVSLTSDARVRFGKVGAWGCSSVSLACLLLRFLLKADPTRMRKEARAWLSLCLPPPTPPNSCTLSISPVPCGIVRGPNQDTGCTFLKLES
jgi:hypothetical protein